MNEQKDTTEKHPLDIAQDFFNRATRLDREQQLVRLAFRLCEVKLRPNGPWMTREEIEAETKHIFESLV